MTVFKLLAGRAIYESNLSLTEKIKHFSKVSILEDDREIISYIAKNVMSERHDLLKAAAITTTVYGGYRGLRALLDPCQKGCGTFSPNDNKRAACIKKCALEKISLQINELENQNCDGSRFKQRCEIIRRTKINELQRKADEISKLSLD